MEEIRHHIEQVKQALRDAGLDPLLVKEFLESQLDVVKQVNLFKKENPYKKDYLINEIKLTEIHLLKDMLDTGYAYEYNREIDVIRNTRELRSLSIKQALVDAGIDPSTVYEFLGSQLEVFKEVNQYNKNELPKEDYAQNILRIGEASKLRDLLR